MKFKIYLGSFKNKIGPGIVLVPPMMIHRGFLLPVAGPDGTIASLVAPS
jgi:hypothetical protein